MFLDRLFWIGLYLVYCWFYWDGGVEVLVRDGYRDFLFGEMILFGGGIWLQLTIL